MGNATPVTAPKFSAKSTAEEVAQEFGDRANGKYVIITGSNVGLGFETARVLCKKGANVTLACRNISAGDAALAAIKAEQPDAKVELRRLDLNDLNSVREFARGYRESDRPLHILINNAGVMACPKSFTSNGLETQFGVNHIGHFLLTMELLSVLKRSGTAQEPARVVNLSSMANLLFAPRVGIVLDDLKGERHYSPWQRYGASKLANILFSSELNRRMQAEKQPVISMSLHPGVITETNLMRHFNGSAAWDLLFSINGWRAFNKIISEPSKNTGQGSATSVYCALSPDVVPGAYYSDCAQESNTHPKAFDSKLAQDLWQASEKIIAEIK